MRALRRLLGQLITPAADADDAVEAFTFSEKDLTVATSSSCPSTPGPAGWSWVSDGKVWQAGALRDASRAEAGLVALAEALEAHARVPGLVIRTDSRYAHDVYCRNMDRWAEAGWVTSAGEPVKNRHLVERCLRSRDARRAAGITAAIVMLAPTHEGHRLGEWAKSCANRALRHARNGSERTWTVGDGAFKVDLARKPRAADRAIA